MEREANYTAVGAFVLLVLAMAGLFVYWYSDSRDHREYTRYEIYFDGSVSGLTRGSAVRYLGVDVGRVIALRIDRRSSARVQIITEIDSTAPISDRTVAQLSLQGVTGLLYIDLIENRGDVIKTEPVESDRYPVIASAPSNFDLFFSSLPKLVAKASDTMERVNKILGDENIASLTATVRNLEKATGRLPSVAENADVVLAELKAASRDFNATMANLHAMSAQAKPDVASALEKMRATAENLASASARLDQFILANEQDIGSFARDGLPEAERLLRDARAAANEMRDLSRELRQQPSSLLREPNYFGVEIPP